MSQAPCSAQARLHQQNQIGVLLHASCILTGYSQPVCRPEQVLYGKGMTLCGYSDHANPPGSPMLKPPVPSLYDRALTVLKALVCSCSCRLLQESVSHAFPCWFDEQTNVNAAS